MGSGNAGRFSRSACWGANRAQGHLLVTLDARYPTFGLAIDLLQVDPEGAEEQKNLRP